ncbi:hypothetical protein D6817_04930 [Candidatus Pacearchaeota archaeon]|nr:MAG: hypothetical protein D6817_04930 [Candidatus Pacearchaeota archaeon]
MAKTLAAGLAMFAFALVFALPSASAYYWWGYPFGHFNSYSFSYNNQYGYYGGPVYSKNGNYNFYSSYQYLPDGTYLRSSTYSFVTRSNPYYYGYRPYYAYVYNYAPQRRYYQYNRYPSRYFYSFYPVNYWFDP